MECLNFSFLKDNFARYIILFDFFPPQCFKYVILLVVASTVSDKRWDVNLLESSLYMLNCFVVAVFKILSLSFSSLVIISLSIDVFEYILFGVYLSSLGDFVFRSFVHLFFIFFVIIFTEIFIFSHGFKLMYFINSFLSFYLEGLSVFLIDI